MLSLINFNNPNAAKYYKTPLQSVPMQGDGDMRQLQAQ